MPKPKIYEAQINVEALQAAVEERGQDQVMDDLLAGFQKSLEYSLESEGGVMEISGQLESEEDEAVEDHE